MLLTKCFFCFPFFFFRLIFPRSLSVRLIDLDTGKRGKKLAGGLADSITLLEFSPDGKFLASACAGGRFINVYSCSGDDNDLLRTLSLVSSPTALSVRASSEKSMVSVAACCEGAQVAFYRFGDSAAAADEPAEVAEFPLGKSF